MHMKLSSIPTVEFALASVLEINLLFMALKMLYFECSGLCSEAFDEAVEITCCMCLVSWQLLIQHANEGLLWRRAPALNEWAGLWDS